MSIQIGPWDPLKLTFNIMDNLMRRNVISREDAIEILMKSLPNTMDPTEKKSIIDQMIIQVNEEEPGTEKSKG